MKNLFVLVAGLLTSVFCSAQYYYVDVIANQQSNANYLLLKQANIGTVKGISYEADGSTTDNFLLEQQFSKNKQVLTTTSTSSAKVTTITNSFFNNNRLQSIVDSLNGVTNRTDYEYDANGNLTKITSQSIDPEHNGNTIEIHQWFYKQNNIPDHMLKIKNNSDTVRVEFSYDEKGNVAEERWRWKNRLINTYYYYYNDANQLTDIVRYNVKAKKMLPDYIFEYNDGKLSQMMQTMAGTSNYLLWKYTYDEKGLKQKDVCFNRYKQQVGRVEYSYFK